MHPSTGERQVILRSQPKIIHSTKLILVLDTYTLITIELKSGGCLASIRQVLVGLKDNIEMDEYIHYTFIVTWCLH